MGAALIADGALPVGALTPIRLRKRRGGAQAQGVARLALIVQQLKALLFVRRHLPLCFCFAAKCARPSAHFATHWTRRVGSILRRLKAARERSVESFATGRRHGTMRLFSVIRLRV